MTALKNIAEIITAGKAALVGNITDGQIREMQQLFSSTKPNAVEVFAEAKAGKPLKASGKIGSLHKCHVGGILECDVAFIVFTDIAHHALQFVDAFTAFHMLFLSVAHGGQDCVLQQIDHHMVGEYIVFSLFSGHFVQGLPNLLGILRR